MKKILSITFCLIALLSCQDIQSQKEMTQMTSSGYKYAIVKDQPGATVQPGQFALVHAVMSYKDSVITDTRMSHGRPTVVKIEADKAKRQGGSGPVQDLLQLLSVGDSARLYYPVDSFPVKPQRLRNYDVVTYDISVLDIFETEEEMNAYLAAEREKINAPMREAKMKEQEIGDMMGRFYASYKQGEKMQAWKETETGLKYVMLEKSGTGLTPKKGDVVRVHCYGLLEADGEPFYNTYNRGEPLEFQVGQGEVIQGWDEALLFLDKGDKAVLLIPSQLAYGSQGYPSAVPPDAALLFYVEIMGIGELE